MTVFPFEIDSDANIVRVDDNLTEIGGEAINQLRDAVFAIEQELGIRPSGSTSSIANRLDVFSNANGTLKASALISVGLATLPIVDNQVAANAGIKEYKLTLDHSTSDLYTLITSNSALLNALVSFANTTDSNLNTHIGGGTLLADGSPARHVASHIDLNSVPSDVRDVGFIWSGLFDNNNVARTATTVAEALSQINIAFVGHQNAVANAHVASSINLNTDNFDEIPTTIDTVQKLADHIDDFELITISDHRATQHANGIPQVGRVTSCSLPDGYGQNVVEVTPVNTFLVKAPNVAPVDSNSVGDDIISFQPVDNSAFLFDAQFSQVQIGDIVRVDYGIGFEASFKVNSIRYVPGTEWVVRVNGINLLDSTTATARIDRPLFDRNTSGILAVAAANATPTGFFSILQSVIVGHPRGAVALGNGFDPGQLDADHYNLWLEMYPTGNPADRVISLPAIDVTGNAGTSPGKYTLDSVVHETNKKLREIGYNFRFIAFADHGNFGIMLADAINCVSFAIISGSIDTGTLVLDTFLQNVIGDGEPVLTATGFDALGLGSTHANLASPAFGSTFIDATIAQLPTKVIVPYKSRDFIVDGRTRDSFAPTWMASLDSDGNGYWDGYISDRTVAGFTVETTYTVFLDLKAAGLKSGKTIVIQPAINFTDPDYSDVDYGRFIIKTVVFPTPCVGDPEQTVITVISGIHGTGSPVVASGVPSLEVKLYFSGDSVSFNSDNIIESSSSIINYHRLHEILIDKDGKTFSHERGRLPIQSESGSLLRTDVWHIENISPKLRGYREATFHKYIRLYILTFDATSGEYTGYIGQRAAPPSVAILSAGPIVTGRKNVPTRFYDETNIDYIDLVFNDESLTLAGSIDILTTAAARYVDIEIFDSIQRDDDLLLLATVEVNWDPTFGQDVIERVTNRREFGSIDEEDFTESAIDFITAGDRNLHDNGIIRGFDFDYIATDNREIFYKGGIALVNGKILTTNAISVTIPQLTENPNAADTIDWAVCVNEDGFLEPILITPTKQQFWALDIISASTYYVPSVTFAELVETRKDLVPIAAVSAAIASVTINDSDVLDVRRLVYDGNNRELVLSPSNFAGTFHTVAGLKNWINEYASSAPTIAKVRGTFDVSTSLDLTGFTYPVILDGDGAVFTVTANKGLLLDANVTVRNCVFNYNPDSPPAYTVDDRINSSDGCIYMASGVDIEKITIENCIFNYTNSAAASQRPPFISMERDAGDLARELLIRYNKFNDPFHAATQAAIAIISLNSGGAEPAVLFNCRIEHNFCNRYQGIFITQYTTAVLDVEEPGITTFDCIIANNNCGPIGIVTTSVDSTNSLVTVTDRESDLLIENNTCLAIANIASAPSIAGTPGTTYLTVDDYSAGMSGGNVTISKNNTSLIWLTNTGQNASSDSNHLIVDVNKVSAIAPATLDSWWIAGNSFTAAGTWGICVQNPQAAATIETTISNNVIKWGRFDSLTYGFDTGIECSVRSNIIGNTIRGINNNGTGIVAGWLAGSPHYVISHNKISRGTTVAGITLYISLSANANVSGLCVDNFLDFPTIDGATTTVITLAATRSVGWLVERNKNQTETIQLSYGDGNFGITTLNYLVGGTSTLVSGIKGSPTSTGLPGSFDVRYTVDTTEDGIRMFWQLPLLDILPNGVEIIDFSCTVSAGTTPGAGSQVNLLIESDTDGPEGPSLDLTTFPGAPVILALSDAPGLASRYFVTNSNRVLVLITTWIVQGGPPATHNVDFSDIMVTYRW